MSIRFPSAASRKRGPHMAVSRTKCITTKVTDEEYARLEELTGHQTMSEWVRTVLLKAAALSADPVVLAEVLGFRTIVLNLLFKISNSQPVTAEDMQRL